MFKQAKFSNVQRIQTKAMLVWWWLCYNLYLEGLTTYNQRCLSRRTFGFGSVSSVKNTVLQTQINSKSEIAWFWKKMAFCKKKTICRFYGMKTVGFKLNKQIYIFI